MVCTDIVDLVADVYEATGALNSKIALEYLICDEVKRANALEFLGYFKNDLVNWIEHVFELQDTQDIHYLDGSFFSSCMQIESIITGTEVDLGDEGEIEFF